MSKVKKEIRDLWEAAKEVNLRRNQMRAIVKVNHCLPKHKQAKFDQLMAEYRVRMFNAEQRFTKTEEKAGIR